VTDLDVLEQVIVRSATAELETDPLLRFLLLRWRAACEATDPREVPALIGASWTIRRLVQCRALRRAARLLQPKGKFSRATATKLAAAIRYFETRQWRLCQSRAPEGDPLAIELRTVFLSGENFPRSVRRLHGVICGQDPQDLSTAEGGNWVIASTPRRENA
jgi:hypothetical protein